MGDDIIARGKQSSPDGRIRIQTHSWRVLQSQILQSANYFTYATPYFELLRAWNVAHTTMDAPTLIKAEEYNQNIGYNRIGFLEQPNSCVYGIDLECFAAKNNVKDSGINTRNADQRIDIFF